MKHAILIFALVYVGYFAYQKFDAYQHQHPEHGSEPYIAIYGRDRCGYTTKLRKYLEGAGIDYEYYSVDDRSSADHLHEKMNGAGISTRRYNLPVVDMSGEISIRPNPQDVVEEYTSAPL
jgi:glutaredoxin